MHHSFGITFLNEDSVAGIIPKMYGPFFPPCANRPGISTFGVSNASHAGDSQVYGPEPKPEREIKETEASTRIQHASNAHKIKLERPLREYNPLARGSVEESDDDACSSNSSGYDEEDNRVKENISRMLQQEANHREALRQQRVLKEYRRQRDERAILDAEMVALKAELAREQAWTRVDDDEETTRAHRAEQAAASLLSTMDQEDIHESAEAAEQFAAYSAAWANFSTNTPTSITVENVPWPPISKNGFLVSMAADELQTVERNNASDDQRQHNAYRAYKTAFRKASLRWHPDKFEAKFGARLSEDIHPKEGISHREVILSEVQKMSQRINEEWESIMGSG